jgi:ribosomal protein L30/L7E
MKRKNQKRLHALGLRRLSIWEMESAEALLRAARENGQAFASGNDYRHIVETLEGLRLVVAEHVWILRPLRENQ